MVVDIANRNYRAILVPEPLSHAQLGCCLQNWHGPPSTKLRTENSATCQVGMSSSRPLSERFTQSYTLESCTLTNSRHVQCTHLGEREREKKKTKQKQNGCCTKTPWRMTSTDDAYHANASDVLHLSTCLSQSPLHFCLLPVSPSGIS